MGSTLLVAAVAAVLCPHQVVFVDTATAAVARTVELPGDGLALFAAPDGRVVVPLAGEDSTSVVGVSGRIEQWRGRVFPMFFADFDRMHTVMPEELATLSYPERVPMVRLPLPGVFAARRSACSADGRLVAVVPSGSGQRSLVMVAALEGGTVSRVALTEEASEVALAPQGTFAITISQSGTVEVIGAGQTRPLGTLDLKGSGRAVVATPDGRGALAGLALGRGGEVVGLKVDVSAKRPLKERSRTTLRSAPLALAVGEDEVVAATADGVIVLSRAGTSVRREIALVGARGVVLLSARPRSAVPGWSDGPTP